jgi:hypothetical protein
LLQILACWLVFVVLIGGLGLPLTASLPLASDERINLGAVAGCLAVYLAAWIVYWCGLSVGAFWVLPAAAGVMCLLRWPRLKTLWRDPAGQRMVTLWLILAAWCLGLLALIRSYSGGEWVGDWLEHYDRTHFFLEHRPLDTLFLLQQYPLPARPPLANLVSGAFMALTGTGFAQFQVFSTLLASLVFFPAVLLARRFARGTDPAAAVLVLLMLSPLFVQNATFAWTKLPAAFFTLSGLLCFLRATREPAGIGLHCAAMCLAAALLTHYSAAPYVFILALAWFVQRRAAWSQPGFWHDLLYPTAIGVMLLSTWLVWSTWHYGVATTFFSNTAVAGNEGLTLAQQFTRRALNFLNTFVPHPLRPAEYIYVQQASTWSWWRDYFFNIYQTNLPLAFGSGGLVVLAVLGWRQRRHIPVFWWWFIPASVLLSIATVSWPDRWGATHIGLQPIVILGLAWLAASLPALGWGLRVWLAVGLMVDFCLGVAGHFWLQHLAFPADLFIKQRGQELLLVHGYATWNNFLTKCDRRLTFVGDSGLPAPLVCGLLAVLLALALWSALRPISKGAVQTP